MFEKLLKNLFRKRKVTDDIKEPVKIKVWNIVEGPFHRDEIDDPNIPEGLEYMLVCLVEVDGHLVHKEYYFSSLDDVYVWKDHFRTKIEPLEVKYD